MFFRIFGANKDSLGVFCGVLMDPKFLAASLCARNCILTIKLLEISKTSKLEFLFVFLEQIRIVMWCSAVL